ncbi:39S ribosomal protein L43, mitochondrial-like [Argiope bruennichi]|uniref:39S ribosomal protein L43, mitochondrial-like n=1 Tax=Argiope bruennichi TaxID=94029 RepID=UPI002494EB1B|nr:39S ribosomal protein L43, mitochondrial-like [Argiope bruennichi]
MSNIVNPSTYVKSVLQNGIGRYVNQLQRITLRFSKTHGGSNGLREYIEKDLVDFARSNPGVVVYLKPRRVGPPSITMEYLNGNTQYLSFPKKSRDEIVKWVEFARTQSGFPISRFIKRHHTDTPSIQGVWNPFTNKSTALNVTDFPNDELSKAHTFFPTATEQLLEIAKNFGTCENQNEEESQSSKTVN